MTAPSIQIDGSFGEGGGQILRTALALSCLTGKPFEIHRIRANRQKPGLRPQHLQCVMAARQIAGAQVTGAEVGSSHVTFEPGPTRPAEYRFDIGTAGSTSLVLQTVFLPLAFAGGPSTVAITGGTHVPFSPCFHYLQRQWLPHLQKAGFSLALHMKRAGYYPEGGGHILAEIGPVTEALPLRLEGRGMLTRVEALSAASNLPRHIADRQAARANNRMVKQKLPFHTDVADLPAHGKGTMLFLLAQFQEAQAGYFALGAIGKRAEKVADEACEELAAFLKTEAAVDRFLGDQLLLPLAVAPGESRLAVERVTQHLLTNAEVIRMFLPTEIHVEGGLDEEGVVTVRGRGLTPT